VATADPFSVEVIYALPDRAIVKAYRLLPTATVGDALALAAADLDFAAVDVAAAAAGIFGKPVPMGRLVQPGDRIELYRALAVDPKKARRERAQRARSQKPARQGACAPRRPR
jgi:hypothetical protein